MNAALNVIKREQLCCLNVLNFRMTSVLHRTVIPESFTFLVLIEKLIFFSLHYFIDHGVLKTAFYKRCFYLHYNVVPRHKTYVHEKRQRQHCCHGVVKGVVSHVVSGGNQEATTGQQGKVSHPCKLTIS